MVDPATRLVQFTPMVAADVAMIAELEKVAYAHPWTAGNLLDAVHHLNHAQLLVCEPAPTDVSPLAQCGRAPHHWVLRCHASG